MQAEGLENKQEDRGQLSPNPCWKKNQSEEKGKGINLWKGKNKEDGSKELRTFLNSEHNSENGVSAVSVLVLRASPSSQLPFGKRCRHPR